MEPGLCHRSEALNFEMSSRIFCNLCTTGQGIKHVVQINVFRIDAVAVECHKMRLKMKRFTLYKSRVNRTMKTLKLYALQKFPNLLRNVIKSLSFFTKTKKKIVSNSTLYV